MKKKPPKNITYTNPNLPYPETQFTAENPLPLSSEGNTPSEGNKTIEKEEQ